VTAVKVWIREFREKLARYLLESDRPLAITCHGETIGYYISARRRRVGKECAPLKESASSCNGRYQHKGISEEEILADFKRWRAGKK
jgi:hypothetical protein